MDDVLLLSRLQFAITAAFHFIFVPLTLGLAVLVAYMETKYVRTNNEMYLRMTKFWGKIFLINFALGVVTGITLEFQFGMNWAGYSKFVGDVFGSLLAIEATAAFFLESTFLGLWIFGWNKISKKLHAFSIWVVAIASTVSALWILLANGWMQNPVGYVLRNDRAEMVDFWALVTNPYGWLKFGHTVLSGYVLAAIFVMGVAAYHILKKSNLEFFKKSFKMAATFGVATSILLLVVGHFHTGNVAKTQPTKFAAMQAQWETERAVPYHIVVIPDVANERNLVELGGIPKLKSFMTFHDANAEIRGLKESPPEDRPAVLATFLSFRIMVALGLLFIILSLIAFIISRKDRLEYNPAFLKIMLYSIPLPYIAGQLGWIVAEVGRQPWIVYGLMRTSDAVSQAIVASQVGASFIGFTLFYGLLGVIGVYLIARLAKKGPDENISSFFKTPKSREV